MKQKLKGRICSIYFDKITDTRLHALSDEMDLSRSAILRLLVAQKWSARADRFLAAAKSFDKAKAKREMALIQAGIDPAEALAFYQENKKTAGANQNPGSSQEKTDKERSTKRKDEIQMIDTNRKAQPQKG